MTATLADTGLPMTGDGWTCEVLDVDDTGRWANEIGGDAQILSDAPSFRVRFVGPDGDVAVVTQSAYVTAFATERAGTEHGLHGAIDHGDWAELAEVQGAERAAWHAGVLDDEPEPLVRYGYDVATEIDRWNAGNTDEDRPDLEDVEHAPDLGSVFFIDSTAEALASAGHYVRDAASTAARDWHPSNI